MERFASGLPGIETFAHLEDGNLIAGTEQDCDPILEDAKARHKEGMTGTADMKHAARLPLVAIETYCNVNGIDLEEWMNNPVHIKRMLMDPALSDFRIWKGAV